MAQPSAAGLQTKVTPRPGGVKINVRSNIATPLLPPWQQEILRIRTDLVIYVSGKGEMAIVGTHSGYPAFEIWVYQDGKPPQQVYGYPENPQNLGGFRDGFFGLCCDVIRVNEGTKLR